MDRKTEPKEEKVVDENPTLEEERLSSTEQEKERSAAHLYS